MFDTIYDGRTLSKDRQYPAWNVVHRLRPMTKDEEGKRVVVENMLVSHVTQQAAIHLSPSWVLANGDPPVEWASITIRNVLSEGIVRTAPDHIDHLFIDGWVKNPGDVLIENVTIRESDQGIQSLFLTNGRFRNIIIRNLSVVNAQTPMIDTRFGGIDFLLIDQCPGVKFEFQGVYSSVKRVVVRNSPGCIISGTDSIDLLLQ